LRPKAHTYAVSAIALKTSAVVFNVHAELRNCCVVMAVTVAQS
jgi:hypothetical protein